jgi:hypothetical protein
MTFGPAPTVFIEGVGTGAGGDAKVATRREAFQSLSDAHWRLKTGRMVGRTTRRLLTTFL